jgi:hypothetical protein
LLTSCAGPGARKTGGGGLQIKVLSNRADLVSGGDALVEIAVPQNTAADGLKVEVDGRDVSAAFAMRTDARVIGLIEGLKNGPNEVVARMSGLRGARLTITNHPIGGPIFSGPQVQPWICATPTARPATAATTATNASGLSSVATDAQCDIPREYKLFYRITGECAQSPRDKAPPCFLPYDPSAPPTDIAETTTDQGVKMKYIVRVERGVIDRAIYDLAVLFDPSQPWSTYQPQAGWNGKLLWSFGGSSGTPYKQFPPNSTWQIDYALARGFLVAVSAHTDQALNSNHVVASEMVMMGKEHIVEQYGPIRYTIGTGCSGGSIMQLQLASLYPGLLDGIQPACTYPDSYSTSIEVLDCVLLVRYFNSPAFATLTRGMSPEQINAKRAAIAGHLDEKACPAWANSFGNSNTPGVYVSPRNNQPTNNCYLLDSQVYDREKNPQGVRCSTAEYAIATWGAMPGTPPGVRIARRTNDNVGVQYGLKALEGGRIGAEEFVTLNEKIGGADLDIDPTAERMVADTQALQIAYEVGIIGNARQWAKVPMIDLRGNDNSNIHMNWRAFAVRDRLNRDNGNHGNQVIWRYGPGLIPPQSMVVEALETMDKWVAAIKADTSGARLEHKVIDHKPAEAFDFCYLGKNYQTKVTDTARCDADPVLKYYASPRQTAGGPLAEDVLKCQLRPLNRKDYGVSFSDDQWSRLRKVFATGVCDWNKPGVGVQPSVPWQSFAEGPGGKPLPPAPTSRPL